MNISWKQNVKVPFLISGKRIPFGSVKSSFQFLKLSHIPLEEKWSLADHRNHTSHMVDSFQAGTLHKGTLELKYRYMLETLPNVESTSTSKFNL